jgi:hypothetical protein
VGVEEVVEVRLTFDELPYFQRSSVDSDPFSTTFSNNQTQDMFDMTTDDPTMVLDDFEEDDLVTTESKTDGKQCCQRITVFLIHGVLILY